MSQYILNTYSHFERSRQCLLTGMIILVSGPLMNIQTCVPDVLSGMKTRPTHEMIYMWHLKQRNNYIHENYQTNWRHTNTRPHKITVFSYKTQIISLNASDESIYTRSDSNKQIEQPTT